MLLRLMGTSESTSRMEKFSFPGKIFSSLLSLAFQPETGTVYSVAASLSFQYEIVSRVLSKFHMLTKLIELITVG